MEYITIYIFTFRDKLGRTVLGGNGNIGFQDVILKEKLNFGGHVYKKAVLSVIALLLLSKIKGRNIPVSHLTG